MKRRHTRGSKGKPEETSDGSGSSSAESNSLLSSGDSNNYPPNNGMSNKKLKGPDNSSSAIANKSSDGAPVKTTLFSAVISRSTKSTSQRRKNSSNNNNDQPKDNPPLTNDNNITKQQNNEVSTPTRNLKSKNNNDNNKRRLLLSPMQSPGGYEILKALDDANLYHEHQKDGDNDTNKNDENDVRPADEFHDAKVYFNGDNISAYDEYNDKSYSRNDNRETKEDLSNIFLDTSIVEATKHAFDLDNNNNMNNANRKCHPPEPCAVGVMDWSIKRRVRLDCIPGKCLPTTNSSSLSSCLNLDEGSIRQLAIQYMSCGGGRSENIRIDDIKYNKEKNSSNEREEDKEDELTAVTQAKWLSSTMYYQHPAIHPLPPSLLQSSTSTEKKTKKKKKDESEEKDLSSFILQQPQSVHNRVRLPGYGCMGGLGISSSLSQDSNNKTTTSILSKQQQQQQQHSKSSSMSTVSSLLYQRRRDWQESFRSMFHTWKSRLKNLERKKKKEEECNETHAAIIPTQDEVSRCSFYSILPHQVVLFRGGYMNVDEQQTPDDNDAKQRHEESNKCKKVLVPIIIFSSTTLYLRSKLQSMGVHLRLFTQNKNSEDGMNYDIFTENLLNANDEKDGTNTHHEDVESVHAELDAIKHADDEKGKVTVEVKKRKQRSARYDPTTTNNRSTSLPPLFVSGDDDCAAVYELFINTCGLSSITLEEQTEGVLSPKPTSTSLSSPLLLDVPLLLCRSLGPCMHTTLRTLSVSSRRDCAYMNQGYTNSQTTGAATSRQRSSTVANNEKATLELRGPVLPCALRDMTCAVINLMLLDEYNNNNKRLGDDSGRYNLGPRSRIKRRSNDEIMDTTTMSSSHQFAMFLQAHDGECSTSAIPKVTGSSSSVHFNGSNIPLLTRQDVGHDDDDDEPDDDDTSTHWHECRQGDCINVLVWDVSRKSVVSWANF